MKLSDINLSQFTFGEMMEIYQALDINTDDIEENNPLSFLHVEDEELEDTLQRLLFLGALLAYGAVDFFSDAPCTISINGEVVGELHEEVYTYMDEFGEGSTFFSIIKNYEVNRLKPLILTNGWFHDHFKIGIHKPSTIT